MPNFTWSMKKYKMPLKYTYNEEENMVKVEATGKLAIAEIESYAMGLLASPDIKQGFIEILNLRGVRDFDFTFDSGRRLSQIYYKLFKEKKFKGSIHLSPDDMQYGISNLMSAILENVSIVYTVREKEEISLALDLL